MKAANLESLNRTISEMVAYRFKLRQVAESLLAYAENIHPYPSRSGDDRATEEELKRKEIVSAAKEVLYNTAMEDTGPETATLQCRECLQDWDTPAETVRYEVDKDSGQMGTFMEYEIATCPHCGCKAFWNKGVRGKGAQ